MKGENVMLLMDELDELFAALDTPEIQRTINQHLKFQLLAVREQYDAVNAEMEVVRDGK